MEELNYIIKQAKRFHYTKWDDSELKKCIDMLLDLNRSELVSLYTSRWISHNKTLKEEVFKLLFSDKIGKLNDKIKEMDTEKLIEELLISWETKPRNRSTVAIGAPSSLP